MSMVKTNLKAMAAGTLAAALSGCNLTGAMDPPAAFPAGVSIERKPFVPSSSAGLAVTPDPDGKKLAKLVAVRDQAGSFGTVRPDPFALTADERIFEGTQLTERVFGSNAGFSTQVTKKPDVEYEVTPPEPQPYRRLSGIVVGDSILAIYEEEGRLPEIVTPGSQIPNSPWRVVSIDTDKAVLRRSGNVRPTQIVVRLETPRNGTAAAGGGGNAPGGFPGGAPGGYPGGSPGGYPGGPSGDAGGGAGSGK